MEKIFYSTDDMSLSVEYDKNTGIVEGFGESHLENLNYIIEDKISQTTLEEDASGNIVEDFGQIYQLFSTNNGEVFNYIARCFNENLTNLRIFDNVPNREQLSLVAGYTCNYGTYVVIPLSFKEHFATGICIKGSFYIFDSTRQLSAKANDNKTIKINGYDFNILNNSKKYQSELTGTCGFWTMFLCSELANSNELDLSDIIKTNPSNPTISENTLDKVARNIEYITKEILDHNKNKIENEFKIITAKIIEDVKNTGKGVQKFTKPNYKRVVKTKGFSCTNTNNKQGNGKRNGKKKGRKTGSFKVNASDLICFSKHSKQLIDIKNQFFPLSTQVEKPPIKLEEIQPFQENSEIPQQSTSLIPIKEEKQLTRTTLLQQARQKTQQLTQQKQVKRTQVVPFFK